MRAVNFQDKKLSIIEQLIILNDDKVFQQVEELINTSLKRPILSRFSVAELKNRAKSANKDIETGSLISQEDVEKQAQSW
jgi:hypothetical protein